MNILLKKAKSLFEQHDLQGSLEAVNQIIQKEEANVEVLLLRARIYYKTQQWGNAMNDYGAVLEIDPNNQEAKTGIDMARSILGYFTPDMFNP